MSTEKLLGGIKELASFKTKITFVTIYFATWHTMPIVEHVLH